MRNTRIRTISVPFDDFRLEIPCNDDGSRVGANRGESDRQRLADLRKLFHEVIGCEPTLELLLKLADEEIRKSDIARSLGIHRGNAQHRVERYHHQIGIRLLCTTIRDLLLKNDRFTLDTRTGKPVCADAWSVSINSHKTKLSGNPTISELEADVEQKRHIISASPLPWYIAGSINRQDGFVHLTICQLVYDKSQAIALATLNDQKFIFHVRKREELWLHDGQWQLFSA